MNLLFFILYALGCFAIYGDLYTTNIGLGKGMKEANPIPRYLFPRIGFALTGWLGGILYSGVALLFANYNLKAASAYCAIVAGLETWMYIRNSKIIKTLK